MNATTTPTGNYFADIVGRVRGSGNTLSAHGIDQVSVLGGDGNDSLGVDLASGNLNYLSGVNYVGGNGADSILISGSTSADTFEVDATSATSGAIRTQVAGGPFSAPTTLTGVEQVSVNGLAPSSNPGDTLRVLDSFVGLPVVPNGSHHPQPFERHRPRDWAKNGLTNPIKMS